jgi:hypothetical protein
MLVYFLHQLKFHLNQVYQRAEYAAGSQGYLTCFEAKLIECIENEQSRMLLVVVPADIPEHWVQWREGGRHSWFYYTSKSQMTSCSGT